MTPARSGSSVIRAVVSDVDGTLVTTAKVLTDRAKAAVAELRARGIPFTIISSRPPRGMRMLLEPLRISAPIAAFNGGIIATPELKVLSEHLIAREVAGRTLEMLQSRGVQAWVFSGQDWLVRDRGAAFVDHEEHTVGFEPTVVADFAPDLGRAAKIVGVSKDYDLLARCEKELSAELAGGANVARSQSYYLDITHPLANKGAGLSTLAELLTLSPSEIAVIGDGRNDIAMFLPSGLSVAMGNASDEVKAKATYVTDSNEDDGFAKAIEQFILPHVTDRRPGHAAIP